MSLRPGQGMSNGGDIWLQWFTCCINQQTHQAKRRPRIDRSMIGPPTNFQHTGHIGSGDISLTTDTSHLHALQSQMKSKGGYESAITVH